MYACALQTNLVVFSASHIKSHFIQNQLSNDPSPSNLSEKQNCRRNVHGVVKNNDHGVQLMTPGQASIPEVL